MFICHWMKRHISFRYPTEKPPHNHFQGIETELQGKEGMKLDQAHVQRDIGTTDLIQGQGTFTQLTIITDREQDHL